MSLSIGQKRARLKLCAQYALDGLSMTQAAARLNLKLPTLSLFLARNDPRTAAALRENGRHGATLSDDDIRRRLNAVLIHGSSALGLTNAAHSIGISYPCLSTWLWKFAPDGAEDALADLPSEE